MSGKGHIAYYISAHGYGHGVRSCDIIRALGRLHSDVRVTIVTDLPEGFLRNRLTPGQPVTFRKGAFDVGMVQMDSIRVDVSATLARAHALYAEKSRLRDQEAAFFREQGIGLAVVDIPAIPIVAARKAGIPAVAIGNFSWDWIYGEFAEEDPRWDSFVVEFEKDYGTADLLIRLPFHAEMGAFKRIVDVPLLASPGRERRREIAAMTGCRPGKKWVLLSFTSLGLDDAALDHIESLSEYDFFTVKPLEWRRKNIFPIDREKIPFSDVVASVDVVVSKPGFGLMSDCLVNGKPLIHADREDFREYAVMLEGVQRYFKNIHIPTPLLYEGKLGSSLEAIWDQPEPEEQLGRGGDEIAAQRMVEFL